MCTCARALFGLESRKANTGRVDSGSFRQPVVRSGGAVRRRGVALRRIPFRAGESLVAPVRPSPTKDAFSIGGDSNRNRKGEVVVERFHGARSYDRGIRDERSQSPAPCRLAAKASDE